MPEITFPTDRDVREVAAKAIEEYLDGKIDNDKLADIIFTRQVQAEDTCREIALELSLYFSDFRQHTNAGKYRVPPKTERTIRRWVLLLRSDWRWPSSRRDSTPRGWLRFLLRLLRSNLCVKSRVAKNEYWPLDSELSWANVDARGQRDGFG